MKVTQINITLGTAGHIDHGKTSLVKCLTGCDTDRLKIEKERGMSIELGFAPCVIFGKQVGIVDVPGHENFIKTMVAGVTGIDGVIFVIAADDGVMPQTREHLDILTLLGVKHGIVALTKADCIEDGRLEIVTSEISSFLAGTFLENSPILPISNITGHGYDAFSLELEKLIESIKPKNIDGIFRMPVERTFSVKGYGTVVTGIAVSGSAKIGDDVMLFPHGTKGKVRAIQVYKSNSDTVVCGQCAAVNIPQWDFNIIQRGNVVSIEKYFSPQQWYLCNLQMLDCSGIIKNGTQVKFHTGTSEVPAVVYLLEGSSVSARQKTLIQVNLSEPVVAGPNDHFILRTLSPVRTVGGGTIVEAIPGKLKRSQPGVLQDAQARAQAVLNQHAFVEYCIKTADAMAANDDELSIRTKIPISTLKNILSELIQHGKIIHLKGNLYIHKDIVAQAQKLLLEIVHSFHTNNPKSPGISMDEFCQNSKFQKGVFAEIVNSLIIQNKIAERKGCLALPEHREMFSDNEIKQFDIIESLFKTHLFNPPSCQEISDNTNIPSSQVQKLLKILIEHKKIVQVEINMYFHQEAVDHARDFIISIIKKDGRLESVDFKYLIDTTRKFALPLLDYFDKVGLTNRVGNTRFLKSK